MTRRILKVVFVLALITTLLALSGGEAKAADRFALTRIENSLHQPINFSIRWGSGPWVYRTVFALGSNSEWFQYPVPNNPQSPELYIRFDSDLGPGVSMIEYRLVRYAVPDTTFPGKRYVFVFDGPSGQYIDLVEAN